MRTYKLTISYDGTRYQGWQRQATTDNTIQHILEWSIGKLVGRIFRTFMEKDFNEADFVIAATDDQKTNHEISQICRRKKIPVNAVDQKEDCSFIFPSYVKEGEVVAAFSSGGQSPLITQYLKEKIKPDLNKELGQLAQILGSLRKLAKSCIATEQERKAFYKELLQIGLEDIDSLEEQRINEIIQKYISE